MFFYTLSFRTTKVRILNVLAKNMGYKNCKSCLINAKYPAYIVAHQRFNVYPKIKLNIVNGFCDSKYMLIIVFILRIF